MKRHLILAMAFVLVTALGSGVAATPSPDRPEGGGPGDHAVDDGYVDTPLEVHRAHGHDEQHGTMEGHIPPTQENVDVVGIWTAPRTNKKPGRITDVWSLGNYAYLGTFAPPCNGLGVNVVDISDPTNPTKAAFIPSRPGTRVNDVKVIHLETSAFTGDVLLHSNENCSAHPQRVGGISLWDVTDPTNAQPLAQGVGDTNGGTLPRARQVHNIFAWQDGDEAYAAIVDDEELLDVDILEITDPTNPEHVAETGLPDWPNVNVDAFGGDAFVHDIWFDIVDGIPQLLLSYWDAGWIRLDVTDPENPTIIEPPGDSDYPFPDPLASAAAGQPLLAEGNAHAAVWDWTGRLILAGDEDQTPFRIENFEITTGSNAGPFGAGEFGFTKSVSSFPGGEVSGPTVYGGSACPGQDLDGDGTDDRVQVPDASILDPQVGPDDERVLVTTRGTCFFSDKIRTGEEKGYDVVIIGNHHIGAAGGAAPDAFFCGGQGSPVLGTAAGLCIGHRAMHLIFNDPPEYTPETSDTSPDMPATGTLGERVQASAIFDGRGPFHLLDHDTMEEIDTYAPSEVHDPAFAQGFGELTMHNVEADPTRDLAYIAWYALGFRVLDFSECDTDASDGSFDNLDDPGCVQEVGNFIDQGGNDFWGIHQALDHSSDPDLILLSDRDRGLYIVKFTG
ncbi:MAG TPA: hypothetical protein VF058_07395 [Actinomycetota bacterium]